MQDEVKALQLCQSKVRQKKLPMEVIDAEYQWYAASFAFIQSFAHKCTRCRDRRKLTFYFVAEKRIDFRELVRELFRCALIPCQSVESLNCVPFPASTKPESGWPLCKDQALPRCSSLHRLGLSPSLLSYLQPNLQIICTLSARASRYDAPVQNST